MQALAELQLPSLQRMDLCFGMHMYAMDTKVDLSWPGRCKRTWPLRLSVSDYIQQSSTEGGTDRLAQLLAGQCPAGQGVRLTCCT